MPGPGCASLQRKLLLARLTAQWPQLQVQHLLPVLMIPLSIKLLPFAAFHHLPIPVHRSFHLDAPGPCQGIFNPSRKKNQ